MVAQSEAVMATGVALVMGAGIAAMAAVNGGRLGGGGGLDRARGASTIPDLGRNLAAQLERIQAHSARKFALGKEWLPEDVGDQHGHRLVLVEQAARPVLRVLLEERCRQRLDGRPGIADQRQGGLLGCRSLARSHGGT